METTQIRERKSAQGQAQQVEVGDTVARQERETGVRQEGRKGSSEGGRTLQEKAARMSKRAIGLMLSAADGSVIMEDVAIFAYAAAKGGIMFDELGDNAGATVGPEEYAAGLVARSMLMGNNLASHVAARVTRHVNLYNSDRYAEYDRETARKIRDKKKNKEFKPSSEYAEKRKLDKESQAVRTAKQEEGAEEVKIEVLSCSRGGEFALASVTSTLKREVARGTLQLGDDTRRTKECRNGDPKGPRRLFDQYINCLKGLRDAEVSITGECIRTLGEMFGQALSKVKVVELDMLSVAETAVMSAREKAYLSHEKANKLMHALNGNTDNESGGAPLPNGNSTTETSEQNKSLESDVPESNTDMIKLSKPDLLGKYATNIMTDKLTRGASKLLNGAVNTVAGWAKDRVVDALSARQLCGDALSDPFIASAYNTYMETVGDRDSRDGLAFNTITGTSADRAYKLLFPDRLLSSGGTPVGGRMNDFVTYGFMMQLPTNISESTDTWESSLVVQSKYLPIMRFMGVSGHTEMPRYKVPPYYADFNALFRNQDPGEFTQKARNTVKTFALEMIPFVIQQYTAGKDHVSASMSDVLAKVLLYGCSMIPRMGNEMNWLLAGLEAGWEGVNDSSRAFEDGIFPYSTNAKVDGKKVFAVTMDIMSYLTMRNQKSSTPINGETVDSMLSNWAIVPIYAQDNSVQTWDMALWTLMYLEHPWRRVSYKLSHLYNTGSGEKVRQSVPDVGDINWAPNSVLTHLPGRQRGVVYVYMDAVLPNNPLMPNVQLPGNIVVPTWYTGRQAVEAANITPALDQAYRRGDIGNVNFCLNRWKRTYGSETDMKAALDIVQCALTRMNVPKQNGYDDAANKRNIGTPVPYPRQFKGWSSKHGGSRAINWGGTSDITQRSFVEVPVSKENGAATYPDWYTSTLICSTLQLTNIMKVGAAGTTPESAYDFQSNNNQHVSYLICDQDYGLCCALFKAVDPIEASTKHYMDWGASTIIAWLYECAATHTLFSATWASRTTNSFSSFFAATEHDFPVASSLQGAVEHVTLQLTGTSLTRGPVYYTYNGEEILNGENDYFSRASYGVTTMEIYPTWLVALPDIRLPERKFVGYKGDSETCSYSKVVIDGPGTVTSQYCWKLTREEIDPWLAPMLYEDYLNDTIGASRSLRSPMIASSTMRTLVTNQIFAVSDPGWMNTVGRRYNADQQKGVGTAMLHKTTALRRVKQDLDNSSTLMVATSLSTRDVSLVTEQEYTYARGTGTVTPISARNVFDELNKRLLQSPKELLS